MGNNQPTKINYEDMQTAIRKPEVYLIINTLLPTEQQCLITNTVPDTNEEEIINRCLKENKNIRIIIYGKNYNDENVNKKYQQLYSLGFYNIYLYLGGMFEWLMLQDIYGKELFQTTSKELDLLKYKPKQVLNIELLEY
jgi:hypothetical protein